MNRKQASQTIFQMLGEVRRAERAGVIKPAQRRKRRGKAYEVPDPLCIIDLQPPAVGDRIKEYMAEEVWPDEFPENGYKPWIGRTK